MNKIKESSSNSIKEKIINSKAIEYLKSLKELLGNTPPIQYLLSNEKFLSKLLQDSNNDIDYLCYRLGRIYKYYLISGDKNNYSNYEEIFEKLNALEGNFDFKNWIFNDGVFTHSCNGSMVNLIKKNGLGSPLNKNEVLFDALNFLEKKLAITGEYTKQQSGRDDEVYFTSPGATSFGYAFSFAPERLFLGILKQENGNAIPVVYGENKKDYYRKVIYRKFENNLDLETKKNIEIILEGYFSNLNCIISFPIKDVLDSKNIYFETIKEGKALNLKDFINSNLNFSSAFFTESVGSNANTNNMDNFVMINTVISPKNLHFLQIPDRYDLMQLIAKNKEIRIGDEFDYFTFEELSPKHNSKK